MMWVDILGQFIPLVLIGVTAFYLGAWDENRHARRRAKSEFTGNTEESPGEQIAHNGAALAYSGGYGAADDVDDYVPFVPPGQDGNRCAGSPVPPSRSGAAVDPAQRDAPHHPAEARPAPPFDGDAA